MLIPTTGGCGDADAIQWPSAEANSQAPARRADPTERPSARRGGKHLEGKPVSVKQPQPRRPLTVNNAMAKAGGDLQAGKPTTRLLPASPSAAAGELHTNGPPPGAGRTRNAAGDAPADRGADALTAEDFLHDPPSWRCRCEPADGGGRIVAAGEFDLAVVDVLEDAARALAIAPGGHVIVDLTAVEFVDSSIVAFLLELGHRAAAGSAKLEVGVRADGGVHRTLAICGACDVLAVVLSG
jgi:anti-anti-sigma factor